MTLTKDRVLELAREVGLLSKYGEPTTGIMQIFEFFAALIQSQPADIAVGVDVTKDGVTVVVRCGPEIIYSQLHPLPITKSQPAEAQGAQEPAACADHGTLNWYDGHFTNDPIDLYRQPTVPEGYVIAPKEATQEMKAAGQAEINRLATDGIERYWQDVYGLGYKAMLAAAPSLPGSGDE